MNIISVTELMEEMANAPKEEMGNRSPGERCMYEKQYTEDEIKEAEKFYESIPTVGRKENE